MCYCVTEFFNIKYFNCTSYSIQNNYKYFQYGKNEFSKLYFDFMNTIKSVSVLLLTDFSFDCIKK